MLLFEEILSWPFVISWFHWLTISSDHWIFVQYFSCVSYIPHDHVVAGILYFYAVLIPQCLIIKFFAHRWVGAVSWIYASACLVAWGVLRINEIEIFCIQQTRFKQVPVSMDMIKGYIFIENWHFIYFTYLLRGGFEAWI